MNRLLEAIGAEVAPFHAADKCCGSYEVMIANPGENMAAANIINTAIDAGIEALAVSCPLCEYNLGKQQNEFLDKGNISGKMPTFYFTQLLALALGVDSEECNFQLNHAGAVEYLQTNLLPMSGMGASAR